MKMFFKVQGRPRFFKITEYEKFMNLTLVLFLLQNFKQLSFTKFGYTAKKNLHNYINGLKIIFLFYTHI